jgi:outer membrane protein TolC
MVALLMPLEPSARLALLFSITWLIWRSQLKIGFLLQSSFVCSMIILLVADYGLAQQASPHPLKLDEAVDLALANFPAIQASRAQAAAAREGIRLAQTLYIPRTDMLWQENRATRNNIFGLLLPQAVIPSMSGPALPDQSAQGVWGSAGGVLVSWEPVDFGLRRAQVGLARAQTNQASAKLEVTRLDVAAAAADAFLTLLAAEESVKAAQANVDRMEVFDKSVHVLVNNQLRPGADASRADAELAAARIQFIQAQQSSDLSRIALGEAVGSPVPPQSIEAGAFLDLPPEEPAAAFRLESHPLALEQSAAIETARARIQVLDRLYFPRFTLQASVFGRGSGAITDGRFEGGAGGMVPSVGNWATGLQVTFPLLDIFSIRSRRKIEASNEAAEKARYDQTILALRAQDARAKSVEGSALRIAQTSPIELHAAREAESRSRARYEAQLANVTEVAEAERLLTQAEIDDAVARLAVWRARLAAAKARGDLKPFLQDAAAPVRKKE